MLIKMLLFIERQRRAQKFCLKDLVYEKKSFSYRVIHHGYSLNFVEDHFINKKNVYIFENKTNLEI